MSERSRTPELMPLIESLLNATIDDAGFARLDEILREDPDARVLYRRVVNLHTALPDFVGHAPRLSLQLSDDPADTVVDVTEQDNAEFLRLLMQVESTGKAVAHRDVVDVRPDETNEDAEDPAALSARDLVAVGGYLIGKGLRTRAAAYAGIAALIVLGVVLFNPFATPNKQTNPAAQTPAPTDPGRVNLAVATLTDTHNAQWQADSGTLLPDIGDGLVPGQRLTLTHGFAEITTNDGAIAILQAPCTIELTDSPNGLRLNAGKLVGICETQSSKGFIVYTPDARIIDTGTRFGVAYDGMTQTRVIEGEVILAVGNAGQDTPSTALSAGQTARVAADRSGVIVEPIKDARFVTHWDAVVNQTRLQGAIIFEPAMPTALGIGQAEADTIQMYLERSGLTLAKDARVTLTEPGTYGTYRDLSASVAAGRVVDSYFFHLDPKGESEVAVTLNATIRFDQPILGIIATGEHLAQSHAVIGSAGTTYGNTGLALLPAERDPSGIESSLLSPDTNDRIHLSEDRRTLTIRLYCSEAIDQFRVLVASERESR